MANLRRPQETSGPESTSTFSWRVEHSSLVHDLFDIDIELAGKAGFRISLLDLDVRAEMNLSVIQRPSGRLGIRLRVKLRFQISEISQARLQRFEVARYRY